MTLLKDLKAGTPTTLEKLSKDAHKTQPPSRFTEVSLVKKLSDLGIGRPSTFSSIVSVIQDRGYVQKVKGQQLAPTFLGFTVVNILTHKFPTFTAYDYTATMEEELEKIADGKLTREKFLAAFWRGPKGFEATVKDLTDSIEWEDIRKLATLDLQNGYSIVYNRFGAFLQHDEGTPDAKGYLPSVKLEETDLAEDFRDPAHCADLFTRAKNRMGDREVGVLTGGTYQGWTVTAKDGKYGPFLQAVDPAGKEKPVNQPLPEGEDLSTVTLEAVAPLFAEVKLPRHLSDQYFVGIGKRGAYVGFKKTAKARKATFKSLPEGVNPRTVTLPEVKKIWDEA